MPHTSEELLRLYNRMDKEFRHEKSTHRIDSRRLRLQALKSWIVSNEGRIKEALRADLGKHASETDLTEIKPVLIEIEEALRNLKVWSAPEKVNIPLRHSGSVAKVYPEPKGVVLIISPWNFPFNLSMGPLVSAIAAGCKVVLKPSEWSENCSRLFVEMSQELDGDVVEVICGDAEVAKALLKLPFSHVFFTGSPQVGRLVMKAAAENLSAVTLELGGQNPVIIDESAALEDAAEKLVWAKTMNCGQSCMAPNTIYLPAQHIDRFIGLAKTAFHKYYGEKGLFENEDYGRIISKKHATRLQNLLTDAEETGASCFTSGEARVEDCFMPFAILWGLPPNAAILKEEIFGPILVIQSYANMDELLEKLWGDHPLATYIFSKDKVVADKILNATVSGTACVNDTTLPFVYPGLPFGGIRTSGIGKGHGNAGFRAFTNYRSVVYQRTGITPLKFIYPPFDRVSKQVVNLFVKWL